MYWFTVLQIPSHLIDMLLYAWQANGWIKEFCIERLVLQFDLALIHSISLIPSLDFDFAFLPIWSIDPKQIEMQTNDFIDG